MAVASELDWDNLRFFLMVMRSNSLRQAATRLGVSHPTIKRRLNTLEQQVGLELFDRSADSLQATPEAYRLLEKAEEVEASVRVFERCAGNIDPGLEGTIRLTAPDLVASELLAPEFSAFCKRWPQIELHVETTYELADLGTREADIAFRIMGSDALPDEKLTGRKAAAMYMAVYGEGDCWLGWEDRQQQMGYIEHTPFADLPIKGVLNNIYLQRAACIEGMGLAMLPCFMGDPYLPRRTDPQHAGDLWVLVHPEMRNNPRLQLFRDEMFKALKRLRPLIEGETAES